MMVIGGRLVGSPRVRVSASTPVETYYTPQEVADILKISRKTVLRRFADVEGVVDIGTPETRTKAGTRLLRIPESVLNRFLAERRLA